MIHFDFRTLEPTVVVPRREVGRYVSDPAQSTPGLRRILGATLLIVRYSCMGHHRRQKMNRLLSLGGSAAAKYACPEPYPATIPPEVSRGSRLPGDNHPPDVTSPVLRRTFAPLIFSTSTPRCTDSIGRPAAIWSGISCIPRAGTAAGPTTNHRRMRQASLAEPSRDGDN